MYDLSFTKVVEFIVFTFVLNLYYNVIHPVTMVS